VQAPHIDVCFLARGLLRQVYTRIYFAGDSRLDDDVVLASVPPDRRATLLAMPIADAVGEWSFAIRLQGADETVFFDL
jgi:protocatechuate 3,4-dioxygenase, alpha subunit